MNAALSNQVMGANVSVSAGDVTFLPDPVTGATTRVQVTVFRNSARGNPVSTLIGQIFGVNSADISATAIAEAVPANASTCVKPFAIPDKWTERQTPVWDPTDSFNAAFLPPTFSPDVYKGVIDAAYTGYKRANVGLQLTILPSAGNVMASQYYALNLPGGNPYQENIEECNGAKVTIGDVVAATPLNNGQTFNGVNALIAQDPGASWDSVNNRVVSTMNPSPRIVTVPVYDPAFYDAGLKAGNAQIRVADIVGFFIQNVAANGAITGRIVPVSGLVQGAAPVTTQAFPRTVRLVG